MSNSPTGPRDRRGRGAGRHPGKAVVAKLANALCWQLSVLYGHPASRPGDRHHYYTALRDGAHAVDKNHQGRGLGRWELEEAAKLKAKLDLVETRPRPHYGRPPRKIGVMTCDTGVKAGYRAATVDFVLRLDDGTFIAEHGDVWYCSSSREALKAKMDQVAKVTLDLEWTRYLLVNYQATVRDARWGGHTHLDLDATRDKKTVVLGMTLTWAVVEYSGAVELPGQGTRYMRREVDDGKPSDSQTTEKELPEGLIPYSEEREDVLNKLREAIAQVDRRMVELFRGKPDDVGQRIDSLNASGTRLLDVPKEPHRPAKSKR